MLRTLPLPQIAIVALLLGSPNANADGWPEEVEQIAYPCSADSSDQPALVYTAKATKESPRPLLVALHTWSGDFKQGGGQTVFARWCQQQNWHMIHPNFRGPNWTTDALGSDKAVQDIVDAVAYMQKNHAVDADRIYLVGVSGGGHASLLMAGRHPEIWAGVSAWCGISDIEAWWKQCSKTGRKYFSHIERACGNPGESAEAKAECIKRSPLTYLQKASGVNLDISHGINDGRTGSVPFSHSLYAFDKVIVDKHREETLGGEAIEKFYKTQVLPAGSPPAEKDPLYGDKLPIYRKTIENTRVTIFDGGHEIIHSAALNWLAVQRKGVPAVWEIKEPVDLRTDTGESESGK